VQHVEWGQWTVTSATELARQLGETVWVPSEWPAAVGGPEFVLMLAPEETQNRRNGYHLRGLDAEGRHLVVSGNQRLPGTLESGLRAVPGERFETLVRPDYLGGPHVVVRAHVFDVHISGDALSHEEALDLARRLVATTAGP
jgi:hypothetical protein